MRVVVNDTSCLIDLRKAGLLQAALLLPFEFQIALPLIYSELFDFTPAEIEDLKARGLTVVDLPPEEVARALTYRSAYPTLSFNDCLSMALAASQPGCVLLTGDQSLRRKAEMIAIKVHGVLWVTDQLEVSGRTTYEELHDSLLRLQADPLVFLPKVELTERIAKLRKLLKQ
ncbi:MAG: type II toxin-antitoxin system VapC family toxin [Devosia sp.]|nr:type II toxin-antitoxin system VapC family toxin [Devosia sp.]